MNDEKIEVSIVCNAYNHEKYIKKTLESFLEQKTNFKYEILVHDDASTDDTATIIKKYEEMYPEIVKPIYQKENQYSKGINVTTTYQYPRAKGKYIAFCEGDDFWTDELKLQRQYELMEKHPEINMSAHAASAISEDKELYRIAPANQERVFSTEEVIKGGGAFVSTNTLFYRKSMVTEVPEFYKYLSLDYTLQIWGSLKGGLLYLPQCMAAYRVATPGSWTVRVSKKKELFLRHRQRVIEALKILDKETNRKYTTTIKEQIERLDFNTCLIKADIKGAKRHTALYSELSYKNRLKLYIKNIHFLFNKEKK